MSLVYSLVYGRILKIATNYSTCRLISSLSVVGNRYTQRASGCLCLIPHDVMIGGSRFQEAVHELCKHIGKFCQEASEDFRWWFIDYCVFALGVVDFVALAGCLYIRQPTDLIPGLQLIHILEYFAEFLLG